MRSASLMLILLGLGAFLFAACGDGEAAPTAIPQATATSQLPPTPVLPVVTGMAETTAAPTLVASTVAASIPTATAVPEPTATSVPQPTPTPTATPEPTPAPTLTLEQIVWHERIEAALAHAPCPAAPRAEFPSIYYTGQLIDSHFHIPHLPDSFNGVKPVLGQNVTISDIACTLEQEGTARVFAFFPVFPEVEAQYPLEVARRTMEQYPTLFVPFIMPPGRHDVPPTADADTLSEMLDYAPGLFQGYGEIGLYELEGRRGPDDYPPDAPILLDIYPVAKQHELIVYLHPGEGQEDNLERVLQEHPDVTFIVHGEGIEDEIGDFMEKYPNVFFTVDGLYGDQYLLHPRGSTETFLAALNNYEPLLEKDLATWKDLIEAHPNQFMWGTDRGDAVWTFDTVVGQALVDYARAFVGRLDPAVQEKFAFRNAERLLQDR